MKIHLFFGAFALLVLAGCATTQSISVESRTRTYDNSYDEVFNAVVATLASDGYSINSADRENGIITTDERARLGLRLFQGNRTKVTALVRDSDANVSVILNLATSTANEEGGQDVQIMPPGVAREFYRELFAKISDELVR